MYVTYGAGEEDLLMWGLSPTDNNAQIDGYKAQFGVTNPCAGTEGGGPEAIDITIAGQNFLGYPTYCIVCPDRTLYFDVCWPPTETCFDPYIENCAPPTSAGSLTEPVNEDLQIYPNPSDGSFNIYFNYQGEANVMVYNLLGAVVHEEKITATGQHEMLINLQGIQDGLYLVAVQTGKDTYLQKLKILTR